MSTNRNVVFVNSYVYHIYNRGVEKRTIYSSKRDYDRHISTLDYYRHLDIPFKYSKFITSNAKQKSIIINDLEISPKSIDVLAYCLMPNHFHLLIRQNTDNGISNFIRKTSNSYAKYFNTKNDRVGPLFQNTFKSVWIENDEQLLHVSRYIHLNPVVSSLKTTEELLSYPWSSLIHYVSSNNNSLVSTDEILSFFKSPKSYNKFVFDQADFTNKLRSLESLTLEKLPSWNKLKI
ncbi:transposase [Patescibacteria group bacterium]